MLAMKFLFCYACSVLLVSAFLISGCRPHTDLEGHDAVKKHQEKVVLQTDWFAQPEHGGFYQALAKGYYREVGLDVTIVPGGPNAMTTQQVLRRRAHFAMNRADTIYGLVQQGVPIQLVMATLQHDAQAILLHAQNPITELAQLDGQRIMAIPGLMWIRWLKAKYGIEFTVIPHDFGLNRFFNDPDFIQQCLLTNEPFFAQQHGLAVRVLPLADSGFDPYHGIYALTDTIENNPDMVQRFVAASRRGWRDFIEGDPAPAFELISAANPRMSPELMKFSHQALKNHQLVRGRRDTPDYGKLDSIRLNNLIQALHELGLVETANTQQADWFTLRFVTPE